MISVLSQWVGRSEQAQGGTLFLDEIGDLPWQTQVKLLRVLGGEEDIPIDVRMLSATHRNLERMIVEVRFREDLDQLGPYFALEYAREFEI